MNSQTFSILADGIAGSTVLAPLVSAYTEGLFPLDVEGAEGGLRAIIITAFAKSSAGPLLVVAPSGRDAAEMAASLRSFGVDSALFPWWGTMPYRSPAPSSSVWGERARILSELSGGAPPAVLVTGRRAFASPLPPPEYTAKQRILIKTGDTLDTTALASRLSGWGYTRVQRVQLAGEFAVRGEVADVMTGGGEDGAEAFRVTLDFDRVESIKRFDTVDQSSFGRGDSLETLSLCPLKEVVWDDERIAFLGEKLKSLPEFSGPEFSGNRMDASGGLFEELIGRGRAADEELFFPLAFERPASLTDYYLRFDGAAAVFLEWERLVNAEDALRREYEGLFRNAFRERPVPAPERLLYSFDSVTKNITNRVSFLAIRNPAAVKSPQLRMRAAGRRGAL